MAPKNTNHHHLEHCVVPCPDPARPSVYPQAGITVGGRYSVRVLSAPAEGYLVTALLLPPAPPRLVQLPARRGLNDLTSGPPRPQAGDTLSVTVKR